MSAEGICADFPQRQGRVLAGSVTSRQLWLLILDPPGLWPGRLVPPPPALSLHSSCQVLGRLYRVGGQSTCTPKDHSSSLLSGFVSPSKGSLRIVPKPEAAPRSAPQTCALPGPAPIPVPRDPLLKQPGEGDGGASGDHRPVHPATARKPSLSGLPDKAPGSVPGERLHALSPSRPGRGRG